MSKVSDFLNSKIVKSDVGEETVLTWKETLSYALGRGAQGMNTSMTSSKYINFFLTDVLFKKLPNPMGVASKIRFFCGIFDAINDPMMGVLVDKTRTKDGQVFVAGAALLPYFKDHTPQAYLTSAIISAVFIVVLTRLTYHNTRERAQHQSDTPSVKECFALLFKNRPLLMLFFANIFFLICKIPEQISFYFVADLLFNRKYNVFIDVIKFPGFLLAGILVPKIVEKLGKRADSRRFFQICCVSAIVLHLLFALTTYGGLVNKPAGQSASIFTAILVILFTGLTTIPLEFKNLMQKEMEAETVDYIEWKTGRRVEGIMLSIMSFTGKIENTFASSIGIAILGVVGYVSHTEGSLIQNHSTNLALFAMTTIVPAIGYLLMLIPIHFYNITGEGHRKMMSEIAERRASIAAETAAEMQSAGETK